MARRRGLEEREETHGRKELKKGKLQRINQCVRWVFFFRGPQMRSKLIRWLRMLYSQTPSIKPPQVRPIPPLSYDSAISSWVSDVRACILLRADVMSLSMGPPPLEWLVKNR